MTRACDYQIARSGARMHDRSACALRVRSSRAVWVCSPMTPRLSGGTLGGISRPSRRCKGRTNPEWEHHERKVMNEIGVFTRTAVVILTALTFAAAPARCSRPGRGEA